MTRRIAVLLALGLALALPAVAVAQPHTDEPSIPAETPTHEATEAHDTAHPHHEDQRDANWYHLHWGKDRLGGPLGDGKLGDRPLGPDEKEEPMSAPFLVMVLNFLILVILLVKFGRPVARQVAQTRSDQIKTALDDAARMRDQAKAKLDEYTAKLEASDAEIKKILEGMRADAEDDRKRVIAAAEAQAIAMKKEAEDRIAAEIELARFALAREVAIAAAAAAEKILRDRTTAADQTKLVDTFITDLKASAREERS